MSSHLTLAVNAARDHIQGSDNAPLTLVEYGDYECPSCGSAYPIVKKIQARLGKRLRFVFRNFPLSEVHPHAAHAAAAAEAAAVNGKFWEMHDALYENQAQLGDARLKTLADALGLEGAAVLEAVLSSEYEEHVQEDFMSGVRSGVNGTPTFFINGARHDDSWDEETLMDALNGALGEKR